MSPCRGSRPYLASLEDVREEQLNEEQKALLSKLKMLSSSTRRSYASAFKGYLEARPYVPANIHAARAWVAGVRWGCLLSTLHPDPEIAGAWRETLSHGISIPEVEFHDEIGRRYLYCPTGRQGRRRHRLSSISADFVDRMLSESAQNSRKDLHFALVALAITGCRPCELASMSIEFSEEHMHVTLACAKEKFNEKNSRFRTLTVARGDSMFVRFVNELEVWLEGETTSNPFSTVNAAAMNNLCRRLSLKLWPRRKLVNPSCFRCLFIADLKKDGIPRNEIAIHVGHLALKSASRYGTANQGRTGHRAYLQQREGEGEDEFAARPKG